MLIVSAWPIVLLIICIKFILIVDLLVAENRLTSTLDVTDLPSCTDKNDLNYTSSSSSSFSHSDIIIFRAAETGDTGIHSIGYFLQIERKNVTFYFRTISKTS